MATSITFKNGNSFEIDWKIDKMLFFGNKTILSDSFMIEGLKNGQGYLKCAFGSYAIIISLEVGKDDSVDYEILCKIYNFKSHDYFRKINGNLKQTGSIRLLYIDTAELQDSSKGYLIHDVLHVEVVGSFTRQTKPLFNDAASWGTRLFKNFVDKNFEFKAAEKTIKIHKLMISAESTVLNNLFQNASGNHLDFPEFKFDTIKAAVDYCYAQDISSFFENNDENAIQLLTFADKYDFQTLKPKLENYLCKKITAGNVGNMVKAANKTNAKLLWQACVNFVRKLLNNNSGGPIMDISTFDGQFLKEILQQSLKP